MKCEIYMNDVVMEKMEERWEDNPNVQIERRKNPNNEKEIMKTHLKVLHAQRNFGNYIKLFFYVKFFIMYMITKR